MNCFISYVSGPSAALPVHTILLTTVIEIPVNSLSFVLSSTCGSMDTSTVLHATTIASTYCTSSAIEL